MVRIVRLRCIGTVEVVAGSLSFLMLSDSGHLTGQFLALNGGLRT